MRSYWILSSVDINIILLNRCHANSSEYIMCSVDFNSLSHWKFYDAASWTKTSCDGSAAIPNMSVKYKHLIGALPLRFPNEHRVRSAQWYNNCLTECGAGARLGLRLFLTSLLGVASLECPTCPGRHVTLHYGEQIHYVTTERTLVYDCGVTSRRIDGAIVSTNGCCRNERTNFLRIAGEASGTLNVQPITDHAFDVLPAARRRRHLDFACSHLAT